MENVKDKLFVIFAFYFC